MFVPRSQRPGMEAEADFRELYIRLRGTLVTCILFSLRLSFSARPRTRSSCRAGRRHSSKATSTRSTCSAGCHAGRSATTISRPQSPGVLGFSRQRVETERWIAFRSHWSIDPFYCQPGLQGPARRHRRHQSPPAGAAEEQPEHSSPARYPDGSYLSTVGTLRVRVIDCEITSTIPAGPRTSLYRLATALLDPAASGCRAAKTVKALVARALLHGPWLGVPNSPTASPGVSEVTAWVHTAAHVRSM